MNDDELKELSEDYFRRLNSTALIFNLNKLIEGAEEDTSEGVKSVFEILDKIFLKDYKSDFVEIIPAGTKFYRARIIESDDYGSTDKGIHRNSERLFGFNASESAQPPLSCAKSCRNSPEGVVAIYLADNEVTACTEARPEIRQFVSLAEFELLEDVTILDFSKKSGYTPLDMHDKEYDANARDLLGYVLFLFTEPAYSCNENNYKLTQKIVEHYRKKGYKGFKYNSFYTGGKNFTFFDELMGKFKWIDSRVLLNYATANLFVSLDEDKKQNDLKTDYNVSQIVSDEVKQKLRKNINGAIKL